MNRPLAGFLLLVLTVVAVTVVPMLGGRRVAGSATAVDFPPPPAVGDCVLPPFPTAALSGRRAPEIPVTDVTFGPCAGAKVGEVVALSDAGSVAGDSNRSPARGPCFREIAAYAGLNVSPGAVTVPGGSTDAPVTWMPTLGSEPYLIVPSQQERKAGRSWVACVAGTTMRSDYDGSLRAAFTTGELPNEFGLCWAAADLDLIPDLLPCDQPHPAELLATGWIDDRSKISSADMATECRVIAGQIMRTQDPTRGGAITVVLDQVGLDGASTPNDPLMVGCLVTATGTARLTGTVIGLGDRPAPVTN